MKAGWSEVCSATSRKAKQGRGAARRSANLKRFRKFSYFPAQELLTPFLSQGENLHGERLALAELVEAEIELWPWMDETFRRLQSHYPTGPSTELTPL